MAKADDITPFPDEVDRDQFGHWLSGFTDGEGSFVLALNRHAQTHDHYHAVAYFRIKLRDDDRPILDSIRSFWGCGNISRFDNRRSKVPNARPNASFTVARVADLAATVVPHFQRFPLRAKKARDFAIWRRGVDLLTGVQSRPTRGFRDGPARHFAGTAPKWTAAEREAFAAIVGELKDQRRYAQGN